MNNVVRWQFVLPWLLALVALLAIAQFIVARLIHWKVTESGENRVGAKVDIGDTRVSLWNRRVTLQDVCVANPHAPLRNLVEADRCEIDLEPAALLYKRTVVRQGRVSGLRFGTSRERSGALAGDRAGATLPAGWLDQRAAAAARAWLNRLHQQCGRDLVSEMKSIRLTEELLDRWPDQYDALQRRVTQLNQQVQGLQDQARQAQANPLRHVEFLNRMHDEIARLRMEMDALSRELEILPNVVDADRRAIVAARKHDEQYLNEQLQFERIDANVLTAYLLQEQFTGPIADLMGWLRWMRQMVPAERKTAATTTRSRGQDVLFAGCQRSPDLLIRSLGVQGTARLGGQPFELYGTLTNFSDQPALHSLPMRLRLKTRGSLPLELQATIDRTGPVAKDQLLVDCGSLVLPRFVLGGSDRLRLSLAPTTASLNVKVTLEGDRLSGDIQLVQKQVRLTPGVGPELQRLRLDAALEDSLGNVDSLATRISLTGTLDEPRGELWSNLGPAVAEAVDRALARTAHAYTQQLLASSQQHVNEQLARLDRQIADAEAAFRPQLTGSAASLDKVANDQSDDDGQRSRLSYEQLGDRLPADSLFR